MDYLHYVRSTVCQHCSALPPASPSGPLNGSPPAVSSPQVLLYYRRGGSSQRMPRFLVFGLMIGAMAGVLLTACSGPAASTVATPSAVPNEKLRVALTTTPIPALTSSVLWLAKDLGFYQSEGLDVDLLEVTGSPVAITALQAGD